MLPPTADPPAELPPFVRIDTVAPALFTPFTLNPNTASEFKIEKVTTQSIDESTLHYYWYFDWNASDTVLDGFAVCLPNATCTFKVCSRPGNTKGGHTLLAVVSSAALLPEAVSPTQFPPDTAWDAVQWNISSQGDCVVP